MTGELLWRVFLSMTVPEENVEALAHDLYFARPKPGAKGTVVIKALSSRLGTDPDYTYKAINTDPGKETLEGLGADLKAIRKWPETKKTTQTYLEKIAKRIDIIKGATVPLMKTSAPAAPVTKATALKRVSPSPKGDLSPSLLVLILGGIVYFLVGFSRYASASKALDEARKTLDVYRRQFSSKIA